MNKLILGLALVGLMASCGGEDKGDKKEDSKETSDVSLKIAYYDIGIMFNELDFTQEANKQMQTELLALEQEYQKLQQRAQTSYQRMQNPNLSVDQQLAADRSMQSAQKKMVEMQQGPLYELEMKQAQLQNELTGYLFKYSEEYAKANGINMMYATGLPGGQIMYIDKSFDITEEFTKYVNDKLNAEIQSMQGMPNPNMIPGDQPVGPVPAQ